MDITKTNTTLHFWGLAFLGLLLFANANAKEKIVSPVKVIISGAPEELKENLEAFLPTRRNLKCDSTERRIERFIDASYDKLTEAAEAMGYFSSNFNIQPKRQQNCWQILVTTKPGQTVKVSKIDIQLLGPGKDLPEFKKIMAAPPYQIGDTLVSQDYEDFKSQLKTTANSLGFFDADMSRHIIQVKPSTKQAEVALTFDTAVRYTYGKVTAKQDILKDKYFKRYIRIKEGEPFRSEELIKQQNLLDGSGYYKNVQVRAGYDTAENHVIPVNIEAPRRKRYSYHGTIGFATNDGAFLELGSDTHWINSRGHQLTGTTRLSQNDPAIGLNYKVPLWNPEHEYANLSTSWSRSDNDDIVGTAFKLGIDYNRRNRNNWQQKASIGYLDEKTQIDNEAETRSQLTLFGLSANKTESNHSLFPTKGWRVGAEIRGAAEGFLSDQSVLQSTLSTKYLHTFDNKSKALLRADFGSTFIGDFDELPKSLRFFAGGQNSVRGYSFESLGTADSDGDIIGGENLLTLSAEYEYPVMNNISAAAFVDAGNAFNDWDDYALEVGYGVGVRYKSPLGPVRLDLAVPEDDSSDVHIYFSLGPDL